MVSMYFLCCGCKALNKGLSRKALTVLETNPSRVTEQAVTRAQHMSLSVLKLCLGAAIFLTLITFDGISLCQYTGSTPGSAKNFYTRLVVTVWGVMLCLAFDLLFPWCATRSLRLQSDCLLLIKMRHHSMLESGRSCSWC